MKHAIWWIMIGRSDVRNLRIGIAIGLAWIGILTFGTTSKVFAQSYKVASKAITDQGQVRQLEREIGTIIRSGAALSEADQKTLTDYFVRHVIAGMTQPSSNSSTPNQFPDWRKTVVGTLNELGGSPAKHRYVQGLVFKYAKLLVDDRKYSPAARYNSLLIIGELNEREAQGSGRNGTLAVPMAQARPVLLSVLNSDDAEEMKVGALIGLARHARLIAAAQGEPDPKLVEAFVVVLRQPEPKDGGSADGLTWMRRIAVDALGDVGLADAAKILQPIVSDPDEPMMLRFAATDALGRLKYATNIDFDAAAAVKGIGQLTVQALSVQLDAVQQHLISNPVETREARPVEPPPEGPAGEPEREGRFGEPNREGRETERPRKQPEDPFVKRVRGALRFQLDCARRALEALQRAGTDANTKNAITALRSPLASLLKELDNDTMTPQQLFDTIGPPALQLENAVKSL